MVECDEKLLQGFITAWINTHNYNLFHTIEPYFPNISLKVDIVLVITICVTPENTHEMYTALHTMQNQIALGLWTADINVCKLTSI